MHQIKKETIEHICILAQLELSEEEKRQVEKDMEKMLAMMEQIKEVMFSIIKRKVARKLVEKFCCFFGSRKEVF